MGTGHGLGGGKMEFLPDCFYFPDVMMLGWGGVKLVWGKRRFEMVVLKHFQGM